MAINEVWIEEDCNVCGLCENICPEVFKLSDKISIIKGVKLSDYDEKIMVAIKNCPVIAIKFNEK